MTAYEAVLVDEQTPDGNPEDRFNFDAATDDEAKAKACKWAEDHRGLLSKSLMLIVKKPYDPNSRPILTKRIEFR